MHNRYELTSTKYLSDPEQAELNRVLEKFKDRDFRNCTLIWLTLYTGARASEILNLRVEDFNVAGEFVCIKGLKNSNNREIPIPKWLAKRLVQLVIGREGLIFPIKYRRFKQIWDLYKPVNKKLHSLRHTFAINIYRKRHNIKAVQMALGHRNWNNTMIYANYQYRMDEFRREILG